MFDLIPTRRFGSLALLVLALLPLPPLHAQQEPRTGLIRLRLVDLPESYLGLDTAALENRVCANPVASLSESGPIRVEPRLVIVNDGGGTRGETFILEVTDIVLPTGGRAGTVKMMPTVMTLMGPRTFNAKCGTYIYRLVLHPTAVQPTSNLALLASGIAGAPLRLRGILDATAQLRFELAGQVAYTETVPISLLFDGLALIVGPDAPLLPEESNLILFAERTESGIESRPVCAPELQTLGQFCFETPAQFLELLNSR